MIATPPIVARGLDGAPPVARPARPMRPRNTLGMAGATPVSAFQGPAGVSHPRMAEPSSFKKGGVVKKSGWAHVEKGERFTPVAEEKSSRAKSHMGGGKKSSKSGGSKKGGHKKVHTMHIRHANNGGYIATHDFESPAGGGGGPMPKSEDHILPDMEALQAHVGDHMAQEQEPQGPPPGAAPAGMGSMAGGPPPGAPPLG